MDASLNVTYSHAYTSMGAVHGLYIRSFQDRFKVHI